MDPFNTLILLRTSPPEIAPEPSAPGRGGPPLELFFNSNSTASYGFVDSVRYTREYHHHPRHARCYVTPIAQIILDRTSDREKLYRQFPFGVMRPGTSQIRDFSILASLQVITVT